MTSAKGRERACRRFTEALINGLVVRLSKMGEANVVQAILHSIFYHPRLRSTAGSIKAIYGDSVLVQDDADVNGFNIWNF